MRSKTFILKRGVGLAVAAAALAFAAAVPAGAATVTVDHLPVADEYGDVGSLIPGGTWGQVITAPPSDGRWELTAASLMFLARDGLAVRFEVRRWAGDRSTGPALWSSGRLTPDESLLYHRIDLSPTGVVLDGGEQFVLAATTLGEANPPIATGKFGAWLDDRYAGGGLRSSFAATPDAFDDAPWATTWPNIDVAFAATFAPVPEPEPEPGPEPQPEPQPQPQPQPEPESDPEPTRPPAPAATDPGAADPTAPPASEAPVVVTVASGLPATAAPVAPAAGPQRTCRVPQLDGATRKQARKRLRRAGCRLGRVRGDGLRVRGQSRRPGRLLPADTRVGVVTRG